MSEPRFLRPALVVWAVGKIATVALFPFSHRASVVAFVGVDFYLLYHLLAVGAQGLGRTFTRFETTRQEIWLTIDDGPDPVDTPQILALLAQHEAQATFFVIGQRAAEYPELIQEILRHGHGIAHHTFTHPVASFWMASPRRVRAELDRSLTVLRQLGVSPRWFRPPVGIKNLFLEPALRERGLRTVAWNVRSLDAIGHDPARITTRVLRRIKPGAILLMHEGPKVAKAVRVTALAQVLRGLQIKGYRCVIPAHEQLRR